MRKRSIRQGIGKATTRGKNGRGEGSVRRGSGERGGKGEGNEKFMSRVNFVFYSGNFRRRLRRRVICVCKHPGASRAGGEDAKKGCVSSESLFTCLAVFECVCEYECECECELNVNVSVNMCVCGGCVRECINECVCECVNS